MSDFWLVSRMADLGMSDIELAKLLKMSRSSVATWRMNETVPTNILGNPEKLNELAGVLRMTPLEVLNAAGYQIGYEVDGLHISHEIKELLEVLASAPPHLLPTITRIAMMLAKEIIDLDGKEP